MHQIRIHLASLGTPITGDDQYGGKPVYLSEYKKRYNIGKYEEERPLINRVALHARNIKFQNSAGATMEFDAPYPKDFEIMLKQIRKYSF